MRTAQQRTENICIVLEKAVDVLLDNLHRYSGLTEMDLYLMQTLATYYDMMGYREGVRLSQRAQRGQETRQQQEAITKLAEATNEIKS